MNFKEFLQQNQKFLIMLIFASIMWALNFNGKNFWFDEVETIRIATEDVPKITLFYTGWVYPHPPLFYLILLGWIQLFGSSPFSVRILPYIFALGAIVVLFKLVKKYISERAAIIACLLTILNFMITRYAQECRPYSLDAFLFLLLTYVFLENLKEKSMKLTIILTIQMSLMMYVDYLSVLIIGLQWVFLNFYQILEKKPALKDLIKLQIPYAIAVLCFLPWLPNLSAGRDTANWIVESPTLTNFGGVLARVFGANPIQYNSYLVPIIQLILGLTLLGLICLFRFIDFRKTHHISENYLFLLYIALPVIMFVESYLFVPIFSYRYSTPHVPFFCILFAWTFNELLNHEKLQKYRKIVYIWLIAFGTISAISFFYQAFIAQP